MRLSGEALLIQDIIGGVGRTCQEHVAAMPVRHGGSNAAGPLVRQDWDDFDAAYPKLLKIDELAAAVMLGVGIDQRVGLMQLRAKVAEILGEQKSIPCEACDGVRQPYIHGNNPDRKFERCGACGGEGSIVIAEAPSA